MEIKSNGITIAIAYCAMIIIWSTTPLTIKWSSEGVGFIAGVSGRMLIGAIFALVVCLLWYKKLNLNKNALKVYALSGISIFSAMMLVYYGAQFINSGLISVIYGMSPILTSWFTIHLFAGEKFNLGKFLGAILGTAGLAIIFKQQINFGAEAPIGIAAVLASVAVHSFSAVWIKQIKIKQPALMITTGGLLFSLPLFILSFWLFAEPINNPIPMRSLWSIVYLGILGSVVGFVCYYFVLAHLAASTVALITLMTPVLALVLGNTLNHEEITETIWLGTGLILLGLIMHQLKGWKENFRNKDSHSRKARKLV